MFFLEHCCIGFNIVDYFEHHCVFSAVSFSPTKVMYVTYYGGEQTLRAS